METAVTTSPSTHTNETHASPPTAHVAREIYGLITILAVLQGMELHPPGAWQGAVILFGTTFAVALIEIYADSIAGLIAREGYFTREHLREVAREAAPVLVVAQGPTICLVLSVFGLVSVERAIDLAQIVALILLFGYGVRVGRLLDHRWSRQLIHGVALVLIGGIIVGIKAAFH